MPRSTRLLVKRKMDSCLSHLNIAQDHLVEVAQAYKETHQDYYNYFCGLVQMLEGCKKPIEELKDRI